MKLVTKVRLIHEEDAGSVIRSFFREFDPRSSIIIKGEVGENGEVALVAELEIFFENLPPMESIDSITRCKIMEFVCTPHLCKDEEDEQASAETTEKPLQEEKTTGEIPKATEPIPEEPEKLNSGVETSNEDAEQVSTGEPDSAESEDVTTTETETADIEATASEIPEPKAQEAEKSKNVKQGKQKKCEVPELAEFAAKSESYEAFVNNVATWLNLGKNYQFFVNLAEKVMLPANGELLWKHCQSALGEDFSKSRQNMCTTKVAAKFKGSENEVTILKLLEAIIEYRTYDFQKELKQTGEQESAEETLAEPNLVAGNPVEETTIMSDVLCFKEAVEGVDKTQPIETRVKHVLTAMGVEKLEEKEQEYILEIANVAVTANSMDLDDILSKTNIPEADALSARMTFATFINNVVKEYAPGKQIKLVDFLKELQKGIMLESEIEGITE